MNPTQAHRLADWLREKRDEVGGTDDDVILENYGDTFLPEPLTLGSLLDALDGFQWGDD